MNGDPRLSVLLPVYNAAADLPRWFESVERFATNVIALDDGSTDATPELLEQHPLVDILIRNPHRDSYEGWDDRANRQRLIEVAADTTPDWLLFLDADEAIDADDGVELRRFLNEDALKLFAYGFEIFRMIDNSSTYDPKGLWVYRLFAYRQGMASLAERRLHFVPVPTDIPRERWLRTTLRIQHFGSLTEGRRKARYSKYQFADPDRTFQEDYTLLLKAPREVATWHSRPEELPALVGPTSRYRRPNSTLEETDRKALTVVVIAQNDENVIARSLTAIENQDLSDDYEVIVVGSGSDGTIEAARRIAPGARCIQLPHPVLPGEARNIGLWMGRGEFITFPGSHVWLTPSSLKARLSAHDEGWELVTGGVLNGNESDAGWASYFLDHSSQMPDRPSSQMQGPPGHASYHWRDLWNVGGFPEHMRAGEDTVVNVALHGVGRRTFFEAEASFYHASPCNTPGDVYRHHRKRGKALGQIIRSRSRNRRVPLLKAMVTSWRLARRRIAVIDASINRWGDTYASKYRTVRRQVLLGAVGAGIGAFSEMTSRRKRNSQAALDGEGEILESQVVDDSGIIAIAGRPNVPEFGLMGAGSPRQAVSRLQAFVSYQEQPVVGAFCLTAAAETVTPGRDRSFIDRLEDEVVADYYEAAESADIWLLLQIQHRSGDALQAAQQWAKWLRKPRIGLYFDLDTNADEDLADLVEAVEFVKALADAERIPPKPILASGYPHLPNGVHAPERIEFKEATGIPRDVQKGEWVVLV